MPQPVSSTETIIILPNSGEGETNTVTFPSVVYLTALLNKLIKTYLILS